MPWRAPDRHGFLAFSEIHPDYYQIPKEDREALLAEEQAHAEEEAALRAAEEDDEDDDRNGDDGVEEIDTGDSDEVAIIEDGHLERGFDDNGEDAEEAEEAEEAEGTGASR